MPSPHGPPRTPAHQGRKRGKEEDEGSRWPPSRRASVLEAGVWRRGTRALVKNKRTVACGSWGRERVNDPRSAS
jgi:hypothetical protein